MTAAKCQIDLDKNQIIRNINGVTLIFIPMF